MSRSVILTQLSGYALLTALLYGWLAISDRSAWQILLSALLALAIVCGAAWLLAAALAGEARFPLRRLPKLMFWLLLASAIVIAGLWLADYRARVGVAVASRLTLWLRRPVKPPIAGAVYLFLLRILIAGAVFAVLPFASQAAECARGTATAALGGARYWIACAVLALAGWYLPAVLVGWVPKFAGIPAQLASMLLRFAAAYLIAVAAWLAIAASARRFRYGAIR